MTIQYKADILCDGELEPGSQRRCLSVARDVVVTERALTLPQQVSPQHVVAAVRPVKHLALPEGWVQRTVAPAQGAIAPIGGVVFDVTTMPAAYIAGKTGVPQEARLCPACAGQAGKVDPPRSLLVS